MTDLERLQSENEELKKKISAKSDLVSVSSHKLRTSLSALKWIWKMFKDKDIGPLTKQQEDFVEKGMESNERMIGLVSDLLRLNHADDPTIPLDIKDVDTESLIKETIASFEGEARGKNIILRFDPGTNIPHIKCDKEMIRVVVQNLIENAMKYSDQGDSVSVSETYDEAKNAIRIRVTDTGIGIDEKDQEHIFTKFFRGENAIAKDSAGSGLGLFTIKEIVERHNGSIRFESTKGVGTTFFVTLPVA